MLNKIHVLIADDHAIVRQGLKQILSETDDLAVELYRKELGQTVASSDVPARVHELLTERELARAEKRWDDADAVRKEIEGEGYIIEDTSDGPRLVAKYWGGY